MHLKASEGSRKYRDIKNVNRVATKPHELNKFTKNFPNNKSNKQPIFYMTRREITNLMLNSNAISIIFYIFYS